jgi:hypothetical protein
MKAKHKGQNGFGVTTTGPGVYEIRPRKSSDRIDLISDRFDTARCGTQNRMLSATQSRTRSIAPSRARNGQLSAC